jgi:hypothetical protein
MPVTAPDESAPESDLILGGPPPLTPAIPVGYTPAPPADTAELVARLRLLNIHTQHLWARLEQVRDGAAALDASATLITQAAMRIQQLCDDLEAAIPTMAGQADSLARLTNAWRAAGASPLLSMPDAVGLDAQQQLKELALVEGELRAIIYWTAYLTAAQRLSEWLAQLRPGYALRFDDIFRDEVPSTEDRQQLLRALASTPQLLAPIGGMIDPEQGVVYRYEVETNRRWRSVGWAALALLAATVLVAGVGLIAPQADAVGVAVLAQGWVAALIGVIVHSGVTTTKRLRTSGGTLALPVDRLSIEVNARLGQILLRIAMLLVAYLGLVSGGLITFETSGAGFLFSAFLTGYSLDSVIDLLSARFERDKLG